jgi:hypothetical protein
VTDERIDLSSLDPGRNPDRIERIVAAVRTGIEAGETSAAAAPPPTWTAQLDRAWIPALLAAAVAAILALAVTRFAEQPPATILSADPLATSIGIPAPIARWAASAEYPPVEEVLTAMEFYPR